MDQDIFDDERVPTAYYPYHGENAVEITACAGHGLAETVLLSGTIQNASYTLATNAGGILMHEWKIKNEPPVWGLAIRLLTEEAKPSGATLQDLAEFCSLDTPMVILNSKGKTFWLGKLGDALPHSFGPNNVAPKNTTQPEPLKP